MKKFEYRILEVKAHGFWGGGQIESEALMQKLNELGKEGWDMASSFSTNMHQGQSRAAILILKRELVEPA